MKTFITNALSILVFAVAATSFWTGSSESNEITSTSMNDYSYSVGGMADTTRNLAARELRRTGGGSNSTYNSTYNSNNRYRGPQPTGYAKTTTGYSYATYKPQNSSYYSYTYKSFQYVPIAFKQKYASNYYPNNGTKSAECKPNDRQCIDQYNKTMNAIGGAVMAIIFGPMCVCLCIVGCCCHCMKKKKAGQQGSTTTTTTQSTTVQQTGMIQPGMQPGMMQPGMQPGMMQPGMMQPGMMQPGMQPGMMQPGMMQPGMMQPGMMQPGMQQPGMMQPGMMQPGMMQQPGQ